MNFKSIVLLESVESDYKKRPKRLDLSNGVYNYEHPLSYEIALDCERFVFKMRENSIAMAEFNQLAIVFVSKPFGPDLQIYEPTFAIKSKVKFVNKYVSSSFFNSLNSFKKREYVLSLIYSSLLLVCGNDKKSVLYNIFFDILRLKDQTKCLWKEKVGSKYTVTISFYSSVTKKYTITATFKNNETNRTKDVELFNHGSFADLVYGASKISLKGDVCFITGKPCYHNGNDDSRMFKLSEFSELQ